MNRRMRKRLRGNRLPTAQEIESALNIVGSDEDFVMKDGGRIVQYIKTGKKFWVWDLTSMLSFISGSSYVRKCCSAAQLPKELPPVVPANSIPHVAVFVPVTVASKVPLIANALHNQVVLSTRAHYDFPTLTAALYKFRRLFTEDTFDILNHGAKMSTNAKHLCCQDVAAANQGLIVDPFQCDLNVEATVTSVPHCSQ